MYDDVGAFLYFFERDFSDPEYPIICTVVEYCNINKKFLHFLEKYTSSGRYQDCTVGYNEYDIISDLEYKYRN